MGNKPLSATITVVLILSSLLAIAQVAEVIANPYWAGFTSPKEGENYPIITIITPQSTVYNTNILTLNVTIPSQCDRLGKISYMYIEEIYYKG